MKSVVTGGAGFIGSHLVDALVGRGDDVHVIDTLASGFAEQINPKAQFHDLDVRNFEGIAPVIAGAEAVFHLAALPRVQFSIEHPHESNDVNVTGFLNVLIAARDGRAGRVVYSSSSSVYGDQKVMPLRESMPPQPQSPYGLQKYVGELYCKLFGEIYDFPTVCLRYFNVYGLRQDPEGPYALVMSKFIKMRAEGKPMTITGDGSQTRDFTHVRDVVRANLLAAESPKVGKGEVINIGAGKNATVLEIAQMIGGPIEHIAPRLEPHDTLADRARAKELLGWEPEVSLAEGIAEMKKAAGLA